MELTYKWIALANRHYLMYLNKRLASYGLSGSQYLFILNICRQPGLTQDKLPDIIHINKSNVTRALALSLIHIYSGSAWMPVWTLSVCMTGAGSGCCCASCASICASTIFSARVGWSSA